MIVHSSSNEDIETVNRLCRQLQSGDLATLDELASIAYRRLWSIAAGILGHPAGNPSMGPTALVGEGFARLLADDALASVVDANHFYSLFARVIRQSLTDYIRMKKSQKRGGNWKRLDFEVILSQYSKTGTDIEDVSEAIEALTKLSPRAANMLDQQCFGRMTIREIAEVTGLSESTVEDNLRIAKAFIRDWMSRHE